ncbi:glycoside hydrolase family 38 N-terminal domain-containing protein [Actinoplanes derwentensis]|uniref:Glycosyl hydrolases family 38 C-terminal domain-containing protein n=1 Tax=Actinoplanes derwentensis TaxID=113562 RepID=A0A1H1RN89_9ACTN|nr:glycoside hydrolase family 38 C-terminal domain-containing protein [Actinoplanes derwentensis]GID84473.1 alpha-mannosidase [Actinoplanes derwentensis]SDS37164.1 Glycosyl hydrolases family 38 C-terminal domain-containing protein [Actinoplanes derwentensis]
MRITAIEGTDLFLGTEAAPRQVVRVTVAADSATSPLLVRVEGPTVRTPEPVLISALAAGDEVTVEVGVRVAAPATAGSLHRVTAVAGEAVLDGQIRAADTGWTMWMVSHFHYDPVWWNTQRGFTEVWQQLPDVPKADKLRPAFVRTAFDLVRIHIDAARLDDDYRFVLAEIDYLKPYWDVYPEDRDDLRRMLREGRVELVGGMYNEPNTNLTHPESTIRNTALGVEYQRDVLGGDPQSAWMLDVFGHDPAFPGLMADAGLTSGSWARGPFHHIGPRRHTGDMERMQFPSEFEWISPSGRGLLTSYMANHYVAGWDVERKETLEEALAEAYNQYRELRKVAATRNVMLPVGHDHNIPSKWCTEIHREWPKRYVWPRFQMGLPRDFFNAVRTDMSRTVAAIPLSRSTSSTSPTSSVSASPVAFSSAVSSGPAASSGPAGSAGFSPQTRDMNPVYTGKDVSYIDTKQAQRAIETIVLDAERLGTLAGLLGTGYPAVALDKAWKLLAYGAHHDAVTGTESDQVYLDLLAGWREAYELGTTSRQAAVTGLAAAADTSGDGQAVLVANSLSWDRGGVVRLNLDFPSPGPSAISLSAPDLAHGLPDVSLGGPPVSLGVPAVVEAFTSHPDGSLASVSLSALAQAVPSLGYQVWHATAGGAAPVTGWLPASGEPVIANEHFRVRADPARGGALTSIVDLRSGRELLRDGGLGGQMVLQEEYADHPYWGEGPWHLLPKGPGVNADSATVHVEHSAVGSRLISVAHIDELTITREVVLFHGSTRVEFRTHVDGSIGQDRLLRVRFDLDLPGALPVSEVGFAAIGRSFGYPELDTAENLWTLDNPAHTWAGLSSTARLRFDGGAQVAIGVAEVIGDGDLRDVVVALVQQGVTSTATVPDGQRYGSLDADSNLPDVRIVIGGNSFADAVLASAGDSYVSALAADGLVFVPALPAASETDLRGPRDLPVLIVGSAQSLITDLDDAVIDVPQSFESDFSDFSVALVNQGTPGFVISRDGSLYLNLMRACTGWPSGVWIDGPRRTVPDGSGFQLQHWTHTFRYSLVAGEGDWRRAGFVQAGQETNHPLLATAVPATPGTLPSSASLGEVSPPSVVLAALKPQGDKITTRVYESSGTHTQARIRLHGGLHTPTRTNVLGTPLPTAPPSPPLSDAPPGRPASDALPGASSSAAPGDVPSSAAHDGVSSVRTGESPSAVLVSEPPSAALAAEPLPADSHGVTADDGDVIVDIDPADIVTVASRPGSVLTVVRSVEPVQPIFTRYWMHNKGPAPLGGLPVTVHISASGPSARLTVSTSTEAASGEVTLDIPPGLTVTPAGPYRYDLKAGDHQQFDLELSGTAEGGHHLVARIQDPYGQLLEDAVTLSPVEILADLSPSALAVAPGDSDVLKLTLQNPGKGPLRGEVQLLSPFGTWGDIGDELSVQPWIQGYDLPPGASTTVEFTVRAAPTARPDSAWWALARVTALGEVVYTDSIPLTIKVPRA